MNVMLAAKVASITVSLFVPLATAGESPRKINKGSVTAVPLPAKAVKNPQRKPAAITITISMRDSIPV
jgi:hypothetical protein